MDYGTKKYLYYSSALLALLFATKETAYIITVILGFYLFMLVTVDNIGVVKKFSFSTKPNLIILIYRFALAVYLKFVRDIIYKRRSNPFCLTSCVAKIELR